MAGVLTTAGIRSLGVFNGTVQNWLKSLTLRLYVNPHSPAVGDGSGAYTQASFPGYAPFAWTTWGAPVLDANNNDQYTAPDATFTCSGGGAVQNVYGYYATDGGGAVVFAEDNGLSGGRPMLNAGDAYIIAGNFYSGQLAGPA